MGVDYFNPPKKETSTMLSIAQLEKNQQTTNTLPEDLCIECTLLTKLFMKPNLHVGRRTKQPEEPAVDFDPEYYNPDNDLDNSFGEDQPMETDNGGQLQWLKKRDLGIVSEVNFAKAAKKINIKRLKENIYRHIRRTCVEAVKEPVVNAAVSAVTEPTDPPLKTPQLLAVGPDQPDRNVEIYPTATSFSEVLRSVTRDPRQKQEISVP